MSCGYPYFVTSTIVEWISVFDSSKYFDILLNNILFYKNKYDMEIIAYVIMPEHFHMICSCLQIKKAMQSLKSYSAKQIILPLKSDCKNDTLKKFGEMKLDYKKNSDYQIWQEVIIRK